MVIDTGATTSVLGIDWYEENKTLLPPLQACPFMVSTADGSKTPIAGFIPKIKMVINKQEIETGLLILMNRKDTEGLLGLDALAQVDAIFNIKERTYVNIKKKNQRARRKAHQVQMLQRMSQ
jgi:predicted aspartyl protease